MAKTHYFVAEYRTHEGAELKEQFFTSKDDYKLHWWEKPTWCTVDAFKDFKIIRDYGWVDYNEDYDTYEQIWKTYYKEYPPQAFNPERDTWNIMGWISPDGVLYPCEYAGHSSLAREIIQSFYDDEYAFLPSEYLFERNWFELSDGGLLRGKYNFDKGQTYLTPKQQSLLADIIKNHPDNNVVDNLIENMSLWVKENE